jgi:hypothetical protein
MHAVQRLRDDELLAGGYERHTNAAGLRYLPRPRTSSINDERAFNCASHSCHASHFAGADVHCEYVSLRQQDCALGCRRSGIADSNLRRVEIPVVTDPHRRYDACRLQERIEAAGPFRRDKLDIKAHTMPALEIGLNNFRVLRSTRDLQAARMHPIKRLTSFLRKRFNLAAGVLDEADH